MRAIPQMLVYASIFATGFAHAAVPDAVLPSHESPVALDYASDPDPINPLPALQSLLDQAHARDLAHDRVWQHLILFRGHAEVTSKGFYLSDLDATHLKKITPQQELDAALTAFQQDPKQICLFPARYFWLSLKLSTLPASALKTCTNLPDANQDVRMLLVSGYLKNPVSTFGHVLITIGAEGERQNLLDHAYNYGAIVPPGENGLTYAVKGLLGFFNARFAYSQFFKQDIIYAKTEQRDMWAYTLNLTPEQKALYIYHLAEVQSRAIGYYFIKQNCAYRTGELLELISDIHTTQHIAPWYPPEYIFDQIEEYRQIHPEFIKNVDYLPSDQAKLYANFALIPQPLQQAINRAIKHADFSQISTLPESDQIKALDFLIPYINFKQIGNPDPRLAQQKRQLVRMRIALPPSDTDPAPIAQRPSPALGEKPSQVEIGIARDERFLNLTVYNKDLLSPNGNPHDEFKMLDFSLVDQHGRVRLAKADFIHIVKIENLAQPLTGENKYSWQLSAGAKPDAYSGALLRPYAQAGIGAGYDLTPHLIGYSMLGAELNDSQAKIDLLSDTALVYLHDDLRAKLIQHFEQRKAERLLRETRFELQYRVAKNADVSVLLSNRTRALSYQYYW